MWCGAWLVQVIDTLSTCDHIEPWAARAAGLVFAQYFWFRHCFLLTGEQGQQVQQLVVHMLSDKKLEVQNLAASSLSGQCSFVWSETDLCPFLLGCLHCFEGWEGFDCLLVEGLAASSLSGQHGFHEVKSCAPVLLVDLEVFWKAQ